MGRDLKTNFFIPQTPTNTDRAAILQRLAEFNRQRAAVGEVGPLAILLNDEVGTTVGGLWGDIIFRWLRIELVFVPETMRGQGVGTELVNRGEELAIARGCVGASLDTYSFQARGFYEKLGYSLVGSIEDCPPGGALHFMKKSLSPRSTAGSVCPEHEQFK